MSKSIIRKKKSIGRHNVEIIQNPTDLSNNYLKIDGMKVWTQGIEIIVKDKIPTINITIPVFNLNAKFIDAYVNVETIDMKER